MNRFYMVIAGCLFATGTMAQKSIGMTLGRYYNWGDSFSWNDELAHRPSNTLYDSAAHASSLMNSSQLQSSFIVGVNFRVKPENPEAFLARWSRNYSVQVCEMTTQELFSRDFYHYDANIPYTTIFQGDTTVYAMDSNKVFDRSMSARGGFAQLGFGLMREIKTETRILGELGFRLSVGGGKLTSYVENTRYFFLYDADKDSPVLQEASFTSSDSRTTSNNLFLGQVELMGGIIIPLAKDDNTWWLNIHGTLGIGAMSYIGTVAGRMSFAPTVGVNYRILPKDQRPVKEIDNGGFE